MKNSIWVSDIPARLGWVQVCHRLQILPNELIHKIAMLACFEMSECSVCQDLYMSTGSVYCSDECSKRKVYLPNHWTQYFRAVVMTPKNI